MYIRPMKIFFSIIVLSLFGACADITQIDAAKEQAAAALSSAQAASEKADEALRTASQANDAAAEAQRDANAAATCCDENTSRLDRMFEKAMAK